MKNYELQPSIGFTGTIPIVSSFKSGAKIISTHILWFQSDGVQFDFSHPHKPNNNGIFSNSLIVVLCVFSRIL